MISLLNHKVLMVNKDGEEAVAGDKVTYDYDPYYYEIIEGDGISITWREISGNDGCKGPIIKSDNWKIAFADYWKLKK